MGDVLAAAGPVVAAGSRGGAVRVLAYPAVVEGAPAR
jgi:hypothetical protein